MTNIGSGMGGGAGQPVAPPLFRLGGMAPPLFDCPVLPACSTVKDTLVDMLLKCLTWWKIVHQIASFIDLRLHFQKSSNFWGGHIPPQTPPCITQARRPHVPFWTSKIWPPHFENCSTAYVPRPIAIDPAVDQDAQKACVKCNLNHV